MTVIREGGCRCGAVRFRTEGAPEFVSHCHCTACRQSTGAAFSTFAGFRDNQVQWVTGTPRFYASSDGVQRGFCAQCGTPLSYQGAKWPGETHLLIGTFDASDDLIPSGNVFTEEALSWVPLTELAAHG